MLEKNIYSYAIQLLTDQDGWIYPYIVDLANHWQKNGYQINISFDIANAKPADFCFCLSFSRIIPKNILDQYKNTLVVHESNLPQGRGWAPMAWQILEGKNRIPVTLLEASSEVDAGVIYIQEWIELDGTELNAEWRRKQAEITLHLCQKWIDTYPEILSNARVQKGKSSFYKKRRPVDSELDPSKSITEQFNLLRVVDNDRFPAFFELKGRRYLLKIE